MTSFRKIITSFSFFPIYWRFRVIRIPQSIKLIFSLIVTFYLTKTEDITKISATQLSHYSLSKGTILVKNADFLQKNAAISKIKRLLVLKAYCENKYGYELTCEVLSFQHNSNQFLTGVNSTSSPSPPLPPAKRTPKNPTQIKFNLKTYYKLGQGFIINWGSFVLLQIRPSVITNWAAQLLQNGANVITN